MSDNTTAASADKAPINQQVAPESAKRPQFIGDIVGIYCELPEEKRPELITAIKEVRERNKAYNDELLENVERMSPEECDLALNLLSIGGDE